MKQEMKAKVVFILGIYWDQKDKRISICNTLRYFCREDDAIWEWMSYYIEMELGNCSLEGEDRDIYRDRVICSEVV